MKYNKILVGILTAAVSMAAASNTIYTYAAAKAPEITVVAGNGKSILVNGESGIASIGAPTGIASGSDSSFYVTDTVNNVIRKISGNKIETYAGTQGAVDLYGEATGEYSDAAYRKEAYFNKPYAIVPFDNGYAISDRLNHTIRYMKDDKIYTLAGNGEREPGYTNGAGKNVSFNGPTGLAADDKGNLYIADTLNHVIRKCDKNGKVTTYAGGIDGYQDGTLKSARFHEPMGLYYANGGLYVSDTGNQRIRFIKGNKVTTIAGGMKTKSSGKDYEEGFQDGASKTALFASPTGIVVSEDNRIFIADQNNGRVRMIKNGKVSTVAAIGAVSDTFPIAPTGLCISGNYLYITDSFSNLVYSIKI